MFYEPEMCMQASVAFRREYVFQNVQTILVRNLELSK